MTWLLYAQLGVFGYFLYGFGPVVPLLRDELGLSRTVAGLYGPALAVGAAVGGTVFPPLLRRVGAARTLWTGLAGISGGVALLCLTASVPGTLACAALTMAFSVVLISAVPVALTSHHGLAGPASISEANAVAAAMGLVAPLLVGLSVTAGVGWRAGLAGAAVLAAVIGLAAWLLRIRIPNTATTSRPATGRLPYRYWVAWTCLLATGSVEVCLSLWASEQLREQAGMTPGSAAAGMSAVLVGMVVGRTAGGGLMLRYGTVPLLLAAIATAGLGFGMFWLATAPWLALTGLVVCGLGVALHFPLGLTLAIQVSDGQPGLAVARTSYGMALGFGAAPFALGALADRVGISWAFLLVPCCLAVGAVTSWSLRRQADVAGASESTAAPTRA